MTMTPLSPAQVRAAIDSGALLVDIRGADEHARERIAESINVPLDSIDTLTCSGRPIVYHCRSGMRTAANEGQLTSAAKGAPVHILDGGIDAWRHAGYATITDRSQPIEVMRQVQITAGALVLAGMLLGLFVSPLFFGLSGFVGAGLILAGATGWCGMAKLLQSLPWNRRAAA